MGYVTVRDVLIYITAEDVDLVPQGSCDGESLGYIAGEIVVDEYNWQDASMIHDTRKLRGEYELCKKR